MTATPSPSPRRAAAAAPPPPCAAATSDRRGRGPLRQALAVAPRPPAAPSRPSPWFTPPADTVRLRGVPINRGAGEYGLGGMLCSGVGRAQAGTAALFQ